MRYSKNLLSIAVLVICATGMASCTEKTPPSSGDSWWTDGDEQVEEPEDAEWELPEPGAEEAYSPSPNGHLYRPITMEYSTSVPVNWRTAKARILPYLSGFDYECTRADYVAHTNKYGSATDLPQQESTGRFYVKKIDGRWWIVDPYGYLHHHRGVASLRQGSSSRNSNAFKEKFGSVDEWMDSTQEELAKVGVHASGAFSDYASIREYNRMHSSNPIILAPSFGFLSAFRSEYGLSYCNGNSNTAAALVLYDEWPEFCEKYIREDLSVYLNDANVLGFFSDNEINFTSNSEYILDRILNSKNTTDIAYTTARQFMDSKGADKVTEELNEEFAGMLAEKYYKGVKEALEKVDKNMLYLGSRLHGKPKYMKSIVQAAGKYCDIISINYYSRWDVELDSAVKNWEEWAPDAPFMVTEFYTKAMDTDLPNTSGAGFAVKTQADRAYAYQHFTLGLLEAKNCVGWHWFKYQDDDGDDNDGKPANKGLFDNYYEVYPQLGTFMKDINYNVYDLIEFFDK